MRSLQSDNNHLFPFGFGYIRVHSGSFLISRKMKLQDGFQKMNNRIDNCTKMIPLTKNHFSTQANFGYRLIPAKRMPFGQWIWFIFKTWKNLLSVSSGQNAWIGWSGYSPDKRLFPFTSENNRFYLVTKRSSIYISTKL